MDENMFFEGVLSDYQSSPEAKVMDTGSGPREPMPSQFNTPDLPYPTGGGVSPREEAVSSPYDDGGNNIRGEEITSAETTPYKSDTISSKPLPVNPNPVQATSKNEFGFKNKKDKVVDTGKEREEVIEMTLGELGTHEGESGDTTGIVETGEKGLTTPTYNDMKKKYGKDISEAEARKYFMGELWDGWSEKKGWKQASKELKAGLLDSGYNLGKAPLKYKKLGKALAALEDGSGDEAAVMAELLDTATSGGQSMKGLAKRRAIMYNKVADNPIVEVEQTENGTIYYRDGEGKVIKRFRPKKGRHPQSRPESIAIR